MRKLSKKLLLSILSVALVFIALGTTTFAWFSMNTNVPVTGMTVSTKVSSNLQIAEVNREANYLNSLNQTRTAVLEPVSTTTGTSFFYHATNEHVLGSGNVDNTTWIAYSEAVTTDPSNALANTNAGKTNYDKAFNTAYGFTAADVNNVAYGYVDYVFYLKATSTEDDQVLRMSECNLLYNGNTVAEKAWRVAILTQASNKDTDTNGDGSLLSILALASAVNFDAGKAVTSTSARGAVTYGTAVTIDNNIDAGQTKYYKVVVRLWLEGDDTTCNNNTFALLTENYSLSLKFDLVASGNAGITTISSTPAA